MSKFTWTIVERNKNCWTSWQLVYKECTIKIDNYSGKKEPLFWEIKTPWHTYEFMGNEIRYEYTLKSLQKEMIKKVDKIVDRTLQQFKDKEVTK